MVIIISLKEVKNVLQYFYQELAHRDDHFTCQEWAAVQDQSLISQRNRLKRNPSICQELENNSNKYICEKLTKNICFFKLLFVTL